MSRHTIQHPSSTDCEGTDRCQTSIATPRRRGTGPNRVLLVVVALLTLTAGSVVSVAAEASSAEAAAATMRVRVNVGHWHCPRGVNQINYVWFHGDPGTRLRWDRSWGLSHRRGGTSPYISVPRSSGSIKVTVAYRCNGDRWWKPTYPTGFTTSVWLHNTSRQTKHI